MAPFEIGVCSWSIDRADVLRSLEVAGMQLGLRAVQIGFFSEQAVRCADADAIRRTAAKAGVTLVGAFVGFEREDYASIERIAATGGFAFDDEYGLRLAVTRDVAKLMGLCALRQPAGPRGLTPDKATTRQGQAPAARLAIHVGTVPTDIDSPLYAKLVSRTGEVADILAEHNVRLLLETGRESAETLDRFIDSVERKNVGVNFDPANFVVYGTDGPVGAVSKLKDRIENVHMKDALRSDLPGRKYGRPAALGSGDAGIPRVLSKLRETGYRGPLLIECGAGHTGPDAVRDAAEHLRSMIG